MRQENADRHTFQPSRRFQDKLYALSSQEALQKFRTNPRRYLLPPMPSAPCRVAVVGPPQAGKSALCRLLAEHYNAVVLDMEALVQLALAKVEQERLDRVREEATQKAIEKVKMNMEPDGDQNSGKLDFDDNNDIVNQMYSVYLLRVVEQIVTLIYL